MARALSDLRHEVRVISPSTERDANFDFDVPVHDPGLPEPDVKSVAELRRVDKMLGKLESGHTSRVAAEVRNLLYNRHLGENAECWRGFAAELVYERYSLFSFGGLELARRLGVPHLLEVNAPLVVEQERARGLHLRDLALEIENRVWRGTDGLLAVSAELRDMAVGRGVANDRAHVVPNGVDALRFVAQPGAGERVRRELDLGDGPVLGFVGSLKSWHGTDVLLHAFAALLPRWPTARLLLVGDGPMADDLRRTADTLGVAGAVRFTGAVEHARIPDLLAAMDVAAAPYLPSDDFYFSPIKVYEYLAAGRAVVASRLGQISAMIEAGLVVPAEPGDPTSLAAALESVLRAPDKAAEQAARGRDWTLRERTWTANARCLVELASTFASART
jgi:glycosyltransferase involved in cell wall biosynthesis